MNTFMKPLNQSGFSMIEVLVSIVILSVGLLGTAGLMGKSMRNTNTAYYRTQATVLADDILDRMRANLTAAKHQDYNVGAGPAYAASAGSIARYDAEEWVGALTRDFPDAVGTITTTSSGVVTVNIDWDGGDSHFSTESHL